ncbi:MAG TPA: ABC transporter permease, partial [Candidatus Saccharicenans sp.]|nr:ABC transporter permease [Candidatus Saccharicenans sp.]
LVYKEIDKKTIFTLLAKPIHRWEFLLGKYLGLVLTIFIMTVLMSVIFLVVLFLHTFTIEWNILLAILYIFFELCLMTAVALVFSTFTTPILASLYSLAFYLIGHLSWSLELLIKKVKSGGGRAILKVLYVILPDLENFNFKTEVVHQLPIPTKLLGISFAYGLVYTAFLLLLAILIFRRRDFI